MQNGIDGVWDELKSILFVSVAKGYRQIEVRGRLTEPETSTSVAGICRASGGKQKATRGRVGEAGQVRADTASQQDTAGGDAELLA